MSDSTDDILIAQARNGNKYAFSQLIERYQQRVNRIAISMIAYEEVARELAQEATTRKVLIISATEKIPRTP